MLTDEGELVVAGADGRAVVWEVGVSAFEPASDGTFWVTVGEPCNHEMVHLVGPFEVADRVSGGFGRIAPDGEQIAYSDGDCNVSRLAIRDLAEGSTIYAESVTEEALERGIPYSASPVGWLPDGSVVVNVFFGDGVSGHLLRPDGTMHPIALSREQVARFDEANPQGWGPLVTAVVDGAAVVAPWSWEPVGGPVPHAVVHRGVADAAWNEATIPGGHLLLEASDRGVVTLFPGDRTLAVDGVPIDGVSQLRFLPRP